MACALEDSGLRMHPSIFGWGAPMLLWASGQGFPKATRVDRQIDQRRGLKGSYGDYKTSDHAIKRKPGNQRIHEGYQRPWRNDPEAEDRNNREYIGADELSRAWAGHRYGLQALKPAVEVILMFQKPYAGKPVDSITETGAGALWIDGGRIGTGDELGRPKGPDGVCYGHFGQIRTEGHPSGRWPANFYLSHLPSIQCSVCGGTGQVIKKQWLERTKEYGGTVEKWKRLSKGKISIECGYCKGTGIIEQCVRVGKRQVKAGKGGPADTRPTNANSAIYGFATYKNMHRSGAHYGDTDGLETIADWQCSENCPVRRLGEQSGVSKSAMRTVPLADKGDMEARQFTDYGAYRPEQYEAGHDDTGTATRFFFNSDWNHEVAERLAICDSVHYQAKASKKERDAGLEGFTKIVAKRTQAGGDDTRGRPTPRNHNPHPTIKPIALTRWLATLLLPPDPYAPRQILIPFSGSGSEGIGALLAGFEEIVMIDSEQEYCEIAEARMEYWEKKPRQDKLL